MFKHIVGVCVVAQKLCQLPSEVHQAFANLQVVGVVLVRTLGVSRHVELLAQVALRRISHEGRVTGEVEREHPALLALLLSGKCCGIARRIGQSVQLFLVGDMQCKGFVFFQQVLRKLQG